MTPPEFRAAARSLLAGTYVALLAFPWPALPLNIRLVDLLFLPFAVLALWDVERPFARRRLTPLDWCVLAVVVAPAVSLFVTPDLRTSIGAYAKRLYVGAVFVLFAAYFDRAGIRRTLSIFVYGALAVSVASLVAACAYVTLGVQLPFFGEAMPLPYIGTVFRLKGGAEGTEMFANYLTMVWPLACLFAWESAYRGWWLAGLAVIAVAMALSFSHAVAGFAAATVVVTWAAGTARGWRMFRILLATAVVLLVIAINVLLIVTIRDVTWVRDHNRAIPPAGYVYGFQSAEGAARTTIAVSYNPMSYYLLKKVAFDEFRRHPFTGVGVGTFHRVTDRAYEAGILHFPYRAMDPHSTVLGALAETGLPGALACVALFVAALSGSPGSLQSRWAVRALKAAVFGIAVNSLNTDVMHFRFLWVGLAALRALA